MLEERFGYMPASTVYLSLEIAVYIIGTFDTVSQLILSFAFSKAFR